MTGLPGVVSHSPPPSPPSAEHLPTFKPIPSTKTHDVQPHSIANVAAPLPPSPPSNGGGGGGGGSSSLLIAGAIILCVFVASGFIHLLLRFLSRHSSTSPSAPLVLLRRLSSSASAAAEHTLTSPSSPSANRPLSVDEEALIDSLPLFAASSSLVDGDCAICLSRFHPHDLLRLLPSCCHAFHATCIDPWLRSTLSCPLCRSPLLGDPLLPLPVAVPPPPATTAPHTATIAAAPLAGSGGSGSYRVEIGSVSRRSDAPSAPPPPHARSYSLGSSYDYVVEGDVEAVVSALAAHVRREGQEDHKDASVADPAPPGEDVAAAVGEGGGSRNWVRDYVDWVTSSASSSSSLRCSRRGSRRAEGGVGWDVEGNQDEEEGVDAYYAVFQRWLTGAC